MLAGGLSYMISELRTGAIAVFMFLFVASYSPAQGKFLFRSGKWLYMRKDVIHGLTKMDCAGPVAFLYASEAFPVTHREIGMSWSVALNLFW